MLYAFPHLFNAKPHSSQNQVENKIPGLAEWHGEVEIQA